MRFLECMSAGWNISLFHTIATMAPDYSRVLVGMQVPPSEMKEFQAFLKASANRSWDETRNPAYKLFLGQPSRRRHER